MTQVHGTPGDEGLGLDLDLLFAAVTTTALNEFNTRAVLHKTHWPADWISY
jgi:hypothetical protein